jgi:ubiquinol-cytochrome c reductase iron-sulfur subunit
MFFFVVTTQVRWAHTDIRTPDFSDYRRDATKRSTSKNSDSAEARKSFTYLIVGGKLRALN